MTSGALRVEHIAQPAVLVDDLDAALDWMARVLKAYPSERVDITGAGVNNAVHAFANRTYLELIEPYNPASGAYRLLKRFGPGWHMLNVDIVDAESADVEDALASAAARIVQRRVHTERAGSFVRRLVIWRRRTHGSRNVRMSLDIRSISAAPAVFALARAESLCRAAARCWP